MGIRVLGGWSKVSGTRRAQVYNRTRADQLRSYPRTADRDATCSPCDNRPVRMRKWE